MEIITLKDIVKAVDGKIVIEGKKNEYNSISTDTRKIKDGDIFISLKGENFNGNKFVENAVQKGAKLCIVDEILYDEEKIKEVTIIKVQDTKKALLDLAKFYKSTLDVKVVAITGSTGKTSTKDLVAATLGQKFKVFKTLGNFNNEIGMPLMIFNLDKSYDIAVLEMGMNHFDEIHNMAEAAKPDIALITNIGISHIENLGSRENILKAKLEVTDYFNKDSILIVNADNDLLNDFNTNKFNLCKIGTEKNSMLNAKNIKLHEQKICFDVFENEDKIYENFNLDLPGKHNVLNALMSIACGKAFNMTLDEIQRGIKKLQPTSMRLDIIKQDNYTLINDCYNASPDSMKAAIDVMKNIKGNRRIGVFGTMKELGDEAYNAHKMVGEFAKENNVDIIITLGEFNMAFEEGFKKPCKNFNTNLEAANYIKSILKQEDIILFKASRAMKFEEIVNELKKSNS